MRSFFALIRKDLKGYFDQPTGYILIVIFVGVLSYLFFRTAFLTGEASLRPLFSILPWLLAVFVPASTMRLLAEEQRDGTLEILLTQPIRSWSVLLAKFLVGLVFVGIGILSTLGVPALLATAGNLDEGAVAAQYLGSLFLTAALVAVGLFTSSLTRNQIVAFILALAINMFLLLMGMELVTTTLPQAASVLVQDLSPLTHFSSISRGVLDLRDVLYFVALVSTFLSATYLTMRSKTLSHHSPLYRNLQLGVVGLVVASLLVGWFGNSIAGRWDVTEDKLYTLSPATGQLLSGLDDYLTIKLFASKDPPVQVSLVARDVNDFLEDFAAKSGGKVKIVRRYPDEDEDAAREARLTGIPPVQFNVQGQGELQVKVGYLGLAMTYADRQEVVPFIDTIDGFEYRIASLAYKMVREQRQTVAFLAGHGEKSKDADMRAFAGLLEEQYNVREIAATGDTPPDLSGVDILIVPGPTQEVPASVQQALTTFLDNGGKAMVLIDPVLVDTQNLMALPNEHSFASFVNRYGVTVDNNLVLDLRSHETLPFSTPLGTILRPYPWWMRVPVIDAKIAGDVQSVVLPWASSLGISEAEIGRVEVVPLLETTPFAALQFDYNSVSPAVDFSQYQDDLGRTLVGVAVIGHPATGNAAESIQETSFRLLVIGDSDWLADNIVSQSQENIALALNLVDWLAQEETLASIRSKVVSSRELLFSSSTHRNLVQYGNIVGVPLLFIALGLLRSFRRRSITLKVYGREK